MEVRRCTDPTELARAAAGLMAQAIEDAVRRRGRCVLAASGGRTPWDMYTALSGAALEWARVHLVQVDERIAPPGRGARNSEGLQTALASVAELHWHLIPVDSRDPAAAARHYAQALSALAGTPPVLDIVHLGLGDDGHTASLVPGDAALDAAGDVAVTGEYRGHQRITLTLAAINRARLIIWVVAGADKAMMLQRLLDGDTAIPAGRVAGGNALVLCDRAAAGV